MDRHCYTTQLDWETLTKPYGVNANGRQHPPYTERGLELAITRGIDPAGNKLLNVMPRYQMSRDDLSDLILYLKRIGKDRDPGISETSIVIGSVVPSSGSLADTGQAVKALMTAFAEEVNTSDPSKHPVRWGHFWWHPSGRSNAGPCRTRWDLRLLVPLHVRRDCLGVLVEICLGSVPHVAQRHRHRRSNVEPSD